MNFLAFDTSGDNLSLGVYRYASRDENLLPLAESESPRFMRHSQILASEIRDALGRARLRLKDLNSVAVGLGPGSFTGLRAGIATAKILAYAAKLKVVGVCSLKAQAYFAKDHEGPVAVLEDARKDKVYAALYVREGGSFTEKIGPCLSAPEPFLRSIKGDVLFVGGAAQAHRELIQERGTQGRFQTKDAVWPQARSIAELALGEFRKKRFIDPYRLEPIYLHPRDCNVIQKTRR